MTFSATVAATLMSVSTMNGGGAGTIPASAAALAAPGMRAADAIVRAVDSVLAEAPPAVVFDVVPLGLVEDGVAINADLDDGDADWEAVAEAEMADVEAEVAEAVVAEEPAAEPMVAQADFPDPRTAAGLEPFDGESPEAATAAALLTEADAAEAMALAEEVAAEAMMAEEVTLHAPPPSPACVAEAYIPACDKGCQPGAEEVIAQEPAPKAELAAAAPAASPVASVLDRAADAFAEIQAEALRLANRLASLAERVASIPAPVTKDAAVAAEPQDEDEAEAQAMEEEPVDAAEPADDEEPIDVHAIDEADVLRDMLEATPRTPAPVAEPEVPIY